MENLSIERSQSLAINRLYNASLKGDMPSLLELLEEDPFILVRCIIENTARFAQSPLHIVTNLGHLELTKEILSRKPELVEELDQLKRWSPLHFASAKGYPEIVQTLLAVNPNMCFARDQDGRNPVHIAAINGHIHVLLELLRAKPLAAMERTNDGETVLHLCVKHNQPEALKLLANVTNDVELLNAKDGYGNTALHLAVAAKQPQVVEHLLGCPTIEKNAMNKNKKTAVDIYLKQSEIGVGDEKIEKFLNRAKAKPAKDALNQEVEKSWLENQRSALMVVASVIATMAFQAGLNPPGGVWQDTKKDEHQAGDAIWSYYDGDDAYTKVLISNTIGLISSLSVIILLISGLPFTRHFLSILRVILWISVTATSYTYLVAITYMTVYIDKILETIMKAVECSLYTWIGLVAIIFLGNALRFIKKVMGWKRRQAIKKFCKSLWFTTRDDNNDIVNIRLDLEVHP